MIKSKFPLAIEILFAVTKKHRIRKIQKRNAKFCEMSLPELMSYNADLYHKAHNRRLDWKKLNTYTEKMQWAKIFDTDERKVRFSDKLLVRDWINATIGADYLIPLLGIWDTYSDIDFSTLPNRFVIKTNHGSSDVIVVKDYAKMSLTQKLHMKRIITESMVSDYSAIACEMHYRKIHPQIMLEQFMGDGIQDLQDYKFLCFDGQVKLCWVDVGRFSNHKRNVYDIDWNLQNWNQFGYGSTEYALPKPSNFEEMVQVAQRLSQGFSHVRVDLYNIDGKIYFGEMTFTNGAGFEPIFPYEADQMLGEMWKIDTTGNFVF